MLCKGGNVKKIFKAGFAWLFAASLAFLAINFLCFFYEREPGWLDTPNGPSASVREPGAYMIHGKEGYSISKIDNNGYTNPNKGLADEIVLMLGSSHTQGKEVSADSKYSVLVNEYFNDNELLHTYNIACDASYLPTQIKHFDAAMKAFPDTSLVTIEIGSTDFSVEQIEKSLAQTSYDMNDSASRFTALSVVGRAKILTKDLFPMLVMIKNNINTLKQATADESEFAVDYEEYKRVLNEALSLIRSETNTPIVFIYHPTVKIEKDGSIQLKYSKTWDVFTETCRNNGIDVIDSGEDFLKYYDDTRKVPYGFYNTTMGSGHLNEVGHRIIANEIIEYMEGLK